MNFSKILPVTLMSVCFVASAAENVPDVIEMPALDIAPRLENVENGIKEVRRDQLNYSIEKDILKETYASNLQTINSVITLILGTFSILAFFGIRSIGSIRQEFQKELQQLRDVREESERRLREIESQQSKAKERLDQIADANVKQDARLKVLELIESVSSTINLGNYPHALEYIKIGLEMDSKNVQLHRFKEHCLLKLGRFAEAMEVQEELLRLDASDSSAASNLCEMSLLLGNEDRYKELSGKFSDVISKREHLGWFFESLRLYMSQEDDALLEHIKKLRKLLPADKKKYLSWGFDECRRYIGENCEREIAALLFRAYSALGGQISSNDIWPEQEKPEDDSKPAPNSELHSDGPAAASQQPGRG